MNAIQEPLQNNLRLVESDNRLIIWPEKQAQCVQAGQLR